MMNNLPEEDSTTFSLSSAHLSINLRRGVRTNGGLAGFCTPPPILFWVVALLSWLTFWTVAIMTTPGDDWLRQDGEHLDWFKIGGTSELDRNCKHDDGVLDGDWCDKFAAFSVVQGAATLSMAMAALMIMIAHFWTIPRPWGIAAGTFLLIYALMQAVAVVLVATMKTEMENSDFAAGNDISGSTASITSDAEFFGSSFPIKLEYGVTFYLALYGSILTFNESLLVYALADYSGEGPLRSCLRCKPCKVADGVYVTPGIFEPRDPSAAPVYPTRSRRIVPMLAGLG